MRKQIHTMNIAGHPIKYSFRYPETYDFFSKWSIPDDGQADIAVEEELIEYGRTLLPPESSDSFVEQRLLISMTAAELLKYDCCLFHAAAFMWMDRAWLLSAPPGTGKTTQLKNWVSAFPKEIRIINGDMPVVERRSDGSMWVHPSPWNGKERLGCRISAPLGGVVYLRQGSTNQISRQGPENLVTSVLKQFLVLPETEEQLRALMRILDSMFTTVPVWAYTNKGDASSTALLRETISDAAGRYGNDL